MSYDLVKDLKTVRSLGSSFLKGDTQMVSWNQFSVLRSSLFAIAHSLLDSSKILSQWTYKGMWIFPSCHFWRKPWLSRRIKTTPNVKIKLSMWERDARSEGGKTGSGVRNRRCSLLIVLVPRGCSAGLSMHSGTEGTDDAFDCNKEADTFCHVRSINHQY